MKSIVANWFSPLIGNTGSLILKDCNSLPGEGQPQLLVSHWDGAWSLNGIQCCRSPIQLNFDKMPKGVTQIEAFICSKGGKREESCSDVYCTYHAAIVAVDEDCMLFAYKDNVDQVNIERLTQAQAN